MRPHIPYYSPQLNFTRVLKAFFTRNAEEQCINFFREYTGKKYILLTNSCRTALYLTYKALGENKKVVASPLICKTALEPIVKSNNTIEFIDIDLQTFNIDIDKLSQYDSNDIFAIHTTYFGGTPLDMYKLTQYAKKNNVLIIEDCAQGFGSKFNGENIGSFGDVACFSLIKTAYGISGGVLATNNKSLYEKVLKIQEGFKKPNLILDIYRLFRSIIDTYRYTSGFFESLYNRLQDSRPSKIKNKESLVLAKPTILSMKVFASIIPLLDKIHTERVAIAKEIVDGLDKSLLTNMKYETVPTKLFVYHKNISSITDINAVRGLGIQAMHLQQKHDSVYQDSHNDPMWSYLNDKSEQYPIYFDVHDHLISIPLLENITKHDIKYIVQQINTLNDEKENMV